MRDTWVQQFHKTTQRKTKKEFNKTQQGDSRQPHRWDVRSGGVRVGGGVLTALHPAVTGKQARHHPCARGYIGL